jgi:hypothetical protein
MLDARLEDGSRVAAMFPPCAVDGPTLTVRKFSHRYTLDDLVGVGTLTRALADSLRAAVDARHNIPYANRAYDETDRKLSNLMADHWQVARHLLRRRGRCSSGRGRCYGLAEVDPRGIAAVGGGR